MRTQDGQTALTRTLWVVLSIAMREYVKEKNFEKLEGKSVVTCTFSNTSHGVLGRDVRRLPRQPGVGVCRRDIDNRASADIARAIVSGFDSARFLRRHCFGHGADADQDPPDVDVHHALKVFNRAVGYGHIGLLGDLGPL